jgi:hypothetical protein
MSLVAIGLKKPYAKTDAGESCACVDVFLLSVAGVGYFFTGLKYLEYNSRIRIRNNDRTIFFRTESD